MTCGFARRWDFGNWGGCGSRSGGGWKKFPTVDNEFGRREGLDQCCHSIVVIRQIWSWWIGCGVGDVGFKLFQAMIGWIVQLWWFEKMNFENSRLDSTIEGWIKLRTCQRERRIWFQIWTLLSQRVCLIMACCGWCRKFDSICLELLLLTKMASDELSWDDVGTVSVWIWRPTGLYGVFSVVSFV